MPRKLAKAPPHHLRQRYGHCSLVLAWHIIACSHTSIQQAQWEGTQAAWAFGEYLVLRSFVNGIGKVDEQYPNSSSLRDSLELLCRLFAVNLMVQKTKDWLSDGYMRPIHMGTLEVRASFHSVIENLCNNFCCWSKATLKDLLLRVRPLVRSSRKWRLNCIFLPRQHFLGVRR